MAIDITMRPLFIYYEHSFYIYNLGFGIDQNPILKRLSVEFLFFNFKYYLKIPYWHILYHFFNKYSNEIKKILKLSKRKHHDNIMLTSC